MFLNETINFHDWMIKFEYVIFTVHVIWERSLTTFDADKFDHKELIFRALNFEADD
jgi:hypothetical protein